FPLRPALARRPVLPASSPPRREAPRRAGSVLSLRHARVPRQLPDGVERTAQVDPSDQEDAEKAEPHGTVRRRADHRRAAADRRGKVRADVAGRGGGRAGAGSGRDVSGPSGLAMRVACKRASTAMRTLLNSLSDFLKSAGSRLLGLILPVSSPTGAA